VTLDYCGTGLTCQDATPTVRDPGTDGWGRRLVIGLVICTGQDEKEEAWMDRCDVFLLLLGGC
jgi:hypothetical protein